MGAATARQRPVDDHDAHQRCRSTLQQIAELTAAGCDIVRVACPSQDDADALAEIAQHSNIPVIADIHFQPKYVCRDRRRLRGRPGQPGQHPPVRRSGRRDRQRAPRPGRASGSASTPAASTSGCSEVRQGDARGARRVGRLEASLFEEHDFHDFKISVKHNDPVVMVKAYELLAERGDWPLHLGVTEAGPAFRGTIKSATAFGALLQGIGDTIRVSSRHLPSKR